MTNKEKFIKQLSASGYLWSYDPNCVTLLPDDIIIEHTLVYADTPDIQKLFALYDLKKIKKVWQTHLLPDSKYRKLNYFLAIFFFNSKNPTALLNKKYETRLEKLQRLAAENA